MFYFHYNIQSLNYITVLIPNILEMRDSIWDHIWRAMQYGDWTTMYYCKRATMQYRWGKFAFILKYSKYTITFGISYVFGYVQLWYFLLNENEQQSTTVNEQQCDTVMETTYENECTTIQEQKCEIQYMTQYEQQCSTQNENVSND